MSEAHKSNIKLILRFCIGLLVISPLVIILHECFHALSAYTFYGATSYLQVSLNSITPFVIKVDNSTGAIFYYSGGLFVSILCFVCYFIFKNKQPVISIIFLIMGICELCYGMYEGWVIFGQQDMVKIWIISIGLGYLLLMYVYNNAEKAYNPIMV